MNIGLIDVDCHAAVKKWGATIYPNIALAKIARYHKERGDNVEWYTPFQQYEVVYMSKIFSFSPEFVQVINNADKIVLITASIPRCRKTQPTVSSLVVASANVRGASFRAKKDTFIPIWTSTRL